MSWSSAGYLIFDPVAQALVDLDASEEIKRRVLGPLIETLRNEDWGTERESLELFKTDPVIVAVFAEHGVTLSSEEE